MCRSVPYIFAGTGTHEWGAPTAAAGASGTHEQAGLWAGSCDGQVAFWASSWCWSLKWQTISLQIAGCKFYAGKFVYNQKVP